MNSGDSSEYGFDEIDIASPSGTSQWYAVTGTTGSGRQRTINFFAESERDTKAIAQGLCIAWDVSSTEHVQHVGTIADFRDMTA